MAYLLVNLSPGRLGSTVDQFHFLGAHDPADLRHRSIQSDGCDRPRSYHFLLGLYFRIYRGSRLEQASSIESIAVIDS